MVINILNATGDIGGMIPENINQGSNKANSIVLIAPFAASITASIRFEFPQTEQITQDFIFNNALSISNEFNVWHLDVEQILTQFYGIVKYQIEFYNGEETICSARGQFNVKQGIKKELPEIPDSETYSLILQNINDIKALFVNGWVESMGLKLYNAEFNYSKGVLVFGVVENENALYKSLIENNNEPLTNIAAWEKVGISGTQGDSVFIRYSKNADGTDFIEEWQADYDYIGIYTGRIASEDKTKYTWALFKGKQGDKGEQGPTGEQGPQGIQGEQGQQGTQGIQGLQGPQGIQGEQGPQGEQGIQGETGLNGQQGPQGDKGDKGDNGNDFTINGTVSSTASLPPPTIERIGEAYFVGTSVPRVIYSCGYNEDNVLAWTYQGYLQGPQGPKGDTGEQGIQGLKGEQGIQGVQGDKGDKGDKGDTGEQGIQGQVGATFVYDEATQTLTINTGA